MGFLHQSVRRFGGAVLCFGLLLQLLAPWLAFAGYTQADECACCKTMGAKACRRMGSHHSSGPSWQAASSCSDGCCCTSGATAPSIPIAQGVLVSLAIVVVAALLLLTAERPAARAGCLRLPYQRPPPFFSIDFCLFAMA